MNYNMPQPNEWINAKDSVSFKPKKKLEPQVDILVTRAVGFKVFACDPRLLKKIVEWKANKPVDSTQPDNFLQDPKKVEELRILLSQPLK